MPTIGTFIQLLPKGFKTARYRSTDATVFAAIEGKGRTRIGDQTFEWGPRDLFVVPSWHWVTHEADADSVLFSFLRPPGAAEARSVPRRSRQRVRIASYRRPGRAQGPITGHLAIADGASQSSSIDHAVWVLGHRRDDGALHRQCSSRASSRLISFPTASPNSDRITTPASS